ncbi:hypothetical protein [Actinosynnema sp. NPDC020468]|uniref:hypothetical protein n=1 Tax=Actinosynnema sp. NPDC020468 TaxID=3154488 RepID=UPI0033DC3257
MARRSPWWVVLWFGVPVLVGGGLLWLGLFLRGQGLERADQFSSVFGLFLNVVGVLVGIGGLVVGVWSLREARRSGDGAADGGSVVGTVHSGRDTYVSRGDQHFGDRR